MRKTRRPHVGHLIAGATCAVLLAAAPPAGAEGSKRLPTLSAAAQLPGSSVPQRVRLPLSGYSTATFQVIARPSSSSVLLGYPATERRMVRGKRTTVKAKPCAQIRLALSLQPSTAAPSDYVAQVIPNPERQGQEVMPQTGLRPVQAWNLVSTIENNWTLRVRAVGARSHGPTGLMRLDMEARTLGNRLPCDSSSRFRLGPNILSVLSMTA